MKKLLLLALLVVGCEKDDLVSSSSSEGICAVDIANSYTGKCYVNGYVRNELPTNEYNCITQFGVNSNDQVYWFEDLTCDEWCEQYLEINSGPFSCDIYREP